MVFLSRKRLFADFCCELQKRDLGGKTISWRPHELRRAEAHLSDLVNPSECAEEALAVGKPGRWSPW